MTKITINWRQDYSILARIDTQLLEAGQEALIEAAEKIRDDMRESVSAKLYPPASKKGESPAKRDGALERGIRVVTQKDRDFAGRFIGKNVVAVGVIAKTQDTTKRPREYAQALDDVHYFDRPYFERPVKNYASIMQWDLALTVAKKWIRKTTGNNKPRPSLRG